MLCHQGCQVGATLNGLREVFLVFNFQCEYIAGCFHDNFACSTLIAGFRGNRYCIRCYGYDFTIPVDGSNLFIRGSPYHGLICCVIGRYNGNESQCIALDKCYCVLAQGNLFYSYRSIVSEREVVEQYPVVTHVAGLVHGDGQCTVGTHVGVHLVHILAFAKLVHGLARVVGVVVTALATVP